jgi:aspartate/methionine/tyrosine aminotransferase
LVAIARFCQKYRLHMISDEIYGMSAFRSSGMLHGGSHNPEGEDAALDGFTSILSLDESDGVDVKNLHMLYGASKDFGMGGLRLGFLVTRNKILWQTVRKLWYSASTEHSLHFFNITHCLVCLRGSHDFLIHS